MTMLPAARTSSASSTPSRAASRPARVSSAQRRTVTVARGVMFRLDRLAQKREHARVAGACDIRVRKVWRLARALGIALPATPVHGAKEGPRNICHALGSALSALFTRGRGPAGRQRTYAYPVRVLGAGVAGVAFCMSDGTVIKTVALRRPAGWGAAAPAGVGRARAASAPAAGAARSGGLASAGRPVPLREFLYEARITRRAHAAFDSARKGRFRVPRLMRHAVLEGQARHGRAGQLVGVMQLGWAPGATLHETLRKSPAAVAAALAARHGRALAAVHERGWIHGDMHSGNVVVLLPPVGSASAAKNGKRKKGERTDPPAEVARSAAAGATFTVIDWARANTKRAVLRHHPGGSGAGQALWRRMLRYEVAHPYRDYMRSASRTLAEAYLGGYLERSGAAQGRGVFGGSAPLVELRALRRHWDLIMNQNVGAMFRALDISSEALQARRARIHG